MGARVLVLGQIDEITRLLQELEFSQIGTEAVMYSAVAVAGHRSRPYTRYRCSLIRLRRSHRILTLGYGSGYDTVKV
jgi:hypothetical protein